MFDTFSMFYKPVDGVYLVHIHFLGSVLIVYSYFNRLLHVSLVPDKSIIDLKFLRHGHLIYKKWNKLQHGLCSYHCLISKCISCRKKSWHFLPGYKVRGDECLLGIYKEKLIKNIYKFIKKSFVKPSRSVKFFLIIIPEGENFRLKYTVLPLYNHFNIQFIMNG